jgi:hypothetical protein
MCASFIYFAFVAIWSNAIDSAEQRMQFVASINTQVGVLTLGIASDCHIGPVHADNRRKHPDNPTNDGSNALVAESLASAHSFVMLCTVAPFGAAKLAVCRWHRYPHYPHRAVAQIFGTGWFISRFGETFGLVMVPLVCTSGMMVYASEQQDPPETRSPFFFGFFLGP